MTNPRDIQHIVISRTDNIGDVILTFPLCGILKSHFPAAKISFLARDYVKDVVTHCVHVDEFLSWDALSLMTQVDAIAFIKQKHIDMVLHVFPNKTIASLMKAARVRYRVGTSRRLFHWRTCNVRENFSRVKSRQHEAQLNLKLLKPLGFETEYSLQAISDYMGLQCHQELPASLKSYIKKDRFNLIVHPLTHKHTLEWPLSHFCALIQQLPADKFNILITGSAAERQVIQDHVMPQCVNAINLAGQCSLQALMQLMMCADGLVANATGPLHVAAGLGIHALGLFPATKGIDPNRWSPVGKKAEYLMADPRCQSLQHMESITVAQVCDVIMGWRTS